MKSYHICQICWEEIIYVSWPVSSSKPMVEHLEKHVKDLIDNKSVEQDKMVYAYEQTLKKFLENTQGRNLFEKLLPEWFDIDSIIHHINKKHAIRQRNLHYLQKIRSRFK